MFTQKNSYKKGHAVFNVDMKKGITKGNELFSVDFFEDATPSINNNF